MKNCYASEKRINCEFMLCYYNYRFYANVFFVFFFKMEGELFYLSNALY